MPAPLVFEDKAYSDAIIGPISEYCQQLDWVDEESNNLADWGDIEGTPTPEKKTPTVNYAVDGPIEYFKRLAAVRSRGMGTIVGGN